MTYTYEGVGGNFSSEGVGGNFSSSNQPGQKDPPSDLEARVAALELTVLKMQELAMLKMQVDR